MNEHIRRELLGMASDNIRKRRQGVHLGFTFEPTQLQRLGSLTVPVLVITGSLDMEDIDMVASEWGKHGAQRVVIPNAAHMVNMEKATEVTGVMLSFLGK